MTCGWDPFSVGEGVRATLRTRRIRFHQKMFARRIRLCLTYCTILVPLLGVWLTVRLSQCVMDRSFWTSNRLHCKSHPTSSIYYCCCCCCAQGHAGCLIHVLESGNNPQDASAPPASMLRIGKYTSV